MWFLKIFLWSSYSPVPSFPITMTGKIPWYSNKPSVTMIITAQTNFPCLMKRLCQVWQTSINFVYLKHLNVTTRQNFAVKNIVFCDLLIEDQVWSKVEHGAVSIGVWPPAQTEHHHPHPWQLNHWHLIIHMQVTETWQKTCFKSNNT